MKENVVLMQEAKESLRGNWGTAAISTLVYSLLESFALIIGGPLELGYVSLMKRIKYEPERADVGALFDGFNHFGRSWVAYILINIFTALWTILFIIPGIVKGISYSMTFFIMSEDETISAYDAIKKSQKMMYGYKLKFFYLILSFIGWILLACLTCGIGLFWVIPYIRMTFLNFYEDLKNNQILID